MRTFIAQTEEGRYFAVSACYGRDAGHVIKSSESLEVQGPLVVYPLSATEQKDTGLSMDPHIVLQIGKKVAAQFFA